MKKHRILFITTSPTYRIEFKIFSEMYRATESKNEKYRSTIITTSENFFRILGNIIKSDTAAFHSPLFLATPYLLIAKILNKKTIAFVWDIYPAKIAGKRYDKRISRVMADFIENILLMLCNNKIVPSKDFLKHKKLSDSKKLKFWPRFGQNLETPPSPPNQSTLKIIFTGQINRTRGLPEAIKAVKSICKSPVEFLVASSDSLPDDLKKEKCVKHIGFLNKKELTEQIRDCDFGLICLSKDLENPGFPSKTFEYVSAGRPCLYYGPELLEFISVIEDSGVGVNIDSIREIDLSTARSMRNNFDEKAKKFQSLTCINPNSIDLFLKICNESTTFKPK